MLGCSGCLGCSLGVVEGDLEGSSFGWHGDDVWGQRGVWEISPWGRTGMGVGDSGDAWLGWAGNGVAGAAAGASYLLELLLIGPLVMRGGAVGLGAPLPPPPPARCRRAAERGWGPERARPGAVGARRRGCGPGGPPAAAAGSPSPPPAAAPPPAARTPAVGQPAAGTGHGRGGGGGGGERKPKKVAGGSGSPEGSRSR